MNEAGKQNQVLLALSFVFAGVMFSCCGGCLLFGWVNRDSIKETAERQREADRLTDRFREIERDEFPLLDGRKMVVTFRVFGDELPKIDDLKKVSDMIARENPSFVEHQVFFLLEGMEDGAGAFATAHRHNGKLDGVKFVMIPENRYDEAINFYGPGWDAIPVP